MRVGVETQERRELGPGLWADARRAVWLEAHRALLVADMHLGQLGIERQRGALVPVVPDDTLERLESLRATYAPARWVFLGDTVHAVARLPGLEAMLRGFVEWLGNAEADFVLGNHDAGLGDRLRALGFSGACRRMTTIGPHVMVHGDSVGWPAVDAVRGPDGRVWYGHEHPAVVLGDGLATSARLPCFLVGADRVVLPAFSRWASGQLFPGETVLSALTEPAAFEQVVAVVGDRLLPLPAAWVRRGRGPGRRGPGEPR